MRRVPLGDRLRAYGRALRFVLYMVWTRVRFGLQLRLGADLLTLQHTAKLRVSRPRNRERSCIATGCSGVAARGGLRGLR